MSDRSLKTFVTVMGCLLTVLVGCLAVMAVVKTYVSVTRTLGGC